MTASFTKALRQAEADLATKDPVLRVLIHTHGPCQITPHTNYYQQLVRTIVGQQLSVKAADTIHSRLCELFSGQTPTAEQLLQTDTEVLRGIGCSYNKVSYMKDLAERTLDGRLNLHTIASESNEEVIAQLVAVKGIGEWSAHMFMMFSLGRLDILPTGDLGIKTAIMRLYDLPTLPTPKISAEIADEHGWAPYQTVASWYLWRSLDNSPQ